MQTDYELVVGRATSEVFDVLAAVDRYHEWLPPSKMYVRTELTGEMGQGCEYVDHHSGGGSMSGVVHIYEPPTRIGFRQERRIAFGRAVIRVEYTLKSDGAGTHILRHHAFDTSLHLRPGEWIFKKRLVAENERVMHALAKLLEGS